MGLPLPSGLGGCGPAEVQDMWTQARVTVTALGAPGVTLFGLEHLCPHEEQGESGEAEGCPAWLLLTRILPFLPHRPSHVWQRLGWGQQVLPSQTGLSGNFPPLLPGL